MTKPNAHWTQRFLYFICWQKELPSGYEYYKSKRKLRLGDDSLKMHLKVHTIDELMKWFSDYSDQSSTTWRVSKTYPKGDNRHSFKVNLLFHHSELMCEALRKWHVGRGFEAVLKIWNCRVKSVQMKIDWSIRISLPTMMSKALWIQWRGSTLLERIFNPTMVEILEWTPPFYPTNPKMMHI